MKDSQRNVVYWASTALFAGMMAASGVAYLTVAEAKQAFDHLGFPPYFRIELALCKLIGAGALLAPLSARVKEWAYAGFAITLLSAAIAHAAVGDGLGKVMAPAVAGLLLLASYATRRH